MQSLRPATVPLSAAACADVVLAAAPGLMRFLRSEMRVRRHPDLSVPQFRGLIYVRRHPRATVSAVAEHIGISVPAASRMIDQLVRRRLLVKTTARSDRRRASLALTSRGCVVFESAWAGMRQSLAARLAALPQGDLEALARGMRALEPLVSQPHDLGEPSPLRRSRRSRESVNGRK